MVNSSTAVSVQTEKPSQVRKFSQDDDKSSVVTIFCRICYDGEKDEPVVTPCFCKGTVAYVHRSCLETWLAESNTTTCELCHHVYTTERTPKYRVKRSIWRWIRTENPNLGFHVRAVRTDLLACALLTPLAIVVTYICLFSADYYNQRRFTNIPAAKWTSVSLLIMVLIMVIGYYLWAYITIQYHSRIWYYWWQRECIVRLPSQDLHPRYTPNENDNNDQNSNEFSLDTAPQDNNEQNNHASCNPSIESCKSYPDNTPNISASSSTRTDINKHFPLNTNSESKHFKQFLNPLPEIREIESVKTNSVSEDDVTGPSLTINKKVCFEIVNEKVL